MRPDEMRRQVERVLTGHQALRADCVLIVACSGGRDSICLLDILDILQKQYGYKLKAVYVHHGLRQEADEEAAWIRGLCALRKIPCAVLRADVAARAAAKRESIEEAARLLRYRLLEQKAEEEEREGNQAWIVTAHHAQDQAETILLHMLRGCGLRGLTGMQEQRGRILRPLLQVDREDIDCYVRDRGLEYREDLSNQDTRYTRNWIRLRLMPVLEEQNASIRKNLCEMAELLKKDEEFLEESADRFYADVYQDGALKISVLQGLSEAVRLRIFRKYLEQCGGLSNVRAEHIRMLDRLLDMQSGSQAQLPGGRTFCRDFGWIRARKRPPVSEEALLDLCAEPVRCAGIRGCFRARQVENPYRNLQKIPDLRYTKWLDCDTITERLRIRTRRPGDYLTAAGGRKSLKKYMIEQKIAQDERDRIPLVADGAHIVWVVGYRLSDCCRIRPESAKVVRIDYFMEEDPQEEVKNCRNQKKME